MARGTHSSARSARPAAKAAGSRASRSASSRVGRRRRLVRLPRIGRDPGDRLIAIGVVLFAVGLIAIALTFIPFVALHRSNTDLAVNLGSFATVLGLALGVLGGYRQARSLRR